MELVNTSDETADTQCDGQPCFEILTRRTKLKETTRYWCGPGRCYIDPHDVDCPRKHLTRPDRKGFNSWM